MGAAKPAEPYRSTSCDGPGGSAPRSQSCQTTAQHQIYVLEGESDYEMCSEAQLRQEESGSGKKRNRKNGLGPKFLKNLDAQLREKVTDIYHVDIYHMKLAPDHDEVIEKSRIF